jgi:hypothetical protein|nr:MAG TPA: hypothetical protein [Caudoviricetes sp.]
MANINPGKGPNFFTAGANGKVIKGLGFKKLSNEERRVTRTGVRLNTANHDTSNIAYWLDSRLPVAFRYNHAEMYNQVVIPKGRIVAVDPDVRSKDENKNITLNVLTLANGGSPVRLRKAGDVYGAAGVVSTDATGKALVNMDVDWVPVAGYTSAYTADLYKPFADGGAKKIARAANLEKDEKTGLLKENGGKPSLVHRNANVPIGMLMRNEYTRDADAWNGMTPGAIKTDVMVELPHFLFKDKAEQNPWGSAYGALKAGDLVKSDENGRIVKSPLSDETAVEGMKVAELEAERQQVIGQVHEVNRNLVPEGSTKWMKWALDDQEELAQYASDGYGRSYRRGEDIYDDYAYFTNADGYEFNSLYSEHDLNMTASNNKLDVYDSRLGAKYEYLGIPGLTDGRNVARTEVKDVIVGFMHPAAAGKDYLDFNFRVPERFIADKTVQISINDSSYTPVVKGAVIKQAFEVVYFDETNGLMRLHVTDKSKADQVINAAPKKVAEVKVKYVREGLAGVPTFMDWEGCVGSVKVLLQK